MKVGETREIFIHPLLGNGIYTTLEKGIYLKVEVELLPIDFSEKFTPLIQESFDPEVFKLAKLDKFNEISKEEGYQRG